MTEQDHETALQVLRDGMKATKSVRSTGEGGRIVYVTVPDHAVRVPTAIKALEWIMGRPVSRSVVANITEEPSESREQEPAKFLLSMLSDPQAAETVSRIIEIAKKSRPVDVTAVQEVAKEAPPTS